MPNNNTGLHSAIRSKKDEFYTQLSDIENELRHYRKHFKGQTVLCNCDDPRVSNFFRYFALNFEALGLKKLIATCYKNCEPDLFSTNQDTHSIYIIYEGDKNGNKVPDPREMEVLPLKGDGDFRSEECIELLKEADIVVTNKKGIYPYVFTKNEKYLNIRAFTQAQKIEAYERQNGICAVCGNHFDIEQMEADHIKPWIEGGKTNADNCQMLCRDCNRRKSSK